MTARRRSFFAGFMQSFLSETKHTLRLALPIMAGQLGQMLLGLADTLMIGRVGAVELAAVAFVNVLIHTAIVLGIALSSGVSVQAAHAHGARLSGAEVLRHGFLLGLGMGTALWVALTALVPVLALFKQPVEVMAVTPGYLVWVAGSAVFLIPCLVIKSFAEARHHPWPVFGLMMGGVVLNILLNRVLIFGMGPVPALGLPGAGIATFAARALTLLGLWIFLHRSRALSGDLPRRWTATLDRRECGTLLRVAAPISGQMLLEFGAFAVSALLIGRFGALPLAAHQIAITCAATTYMLPLGLSMAVSIRVGHALGAGNRERCRSILLGAQATALIIMSGFAGIYLFGGARLAALFTPEPDLRNLTAGLLVITGIFQIFDGIQIISMGGLRGMKDVNTPTVLILINYWGVALPLGAYLAFVRGYGARGFWLGLAAGLALSATGLTRRLIQNLRRGSR
jgi:MATE family multidrug resistance protein